MGYRHRCHFDGCDTVFIDSTRTVYIEHIREEHGRLEADIYEGLVVAECPECGGTHQDERRVCDGCLVRE